MTLVFRHPSFVVIGGLIMPGEVWLGLAAFGFFLVLWLVLPSRLRQKATEVLHHHRAAGLATTDQRPLTAASADDSGQRSTASRPSAVGGRLSEETPDFVRLRSLPHIHGHQGPRYAVEGRVDGFPFTLPVKSGLRRNPLPTLPLVGGGQGGGPLLSEVFSVEISGMRLERSSLTALPEAVLDALEDLRYAGRLPRYAFQSSPVHRGGAGVGMLPIYPWGKGWRLHEPEGPILEADDLGTLRRRLAHYLTLPADDLTLLALSPELRWVPPLCVIQPIERDMPWLPVFALDGTLSVRVDEREFAVSRHGGEEIFALYDQVASYLVQSGVVHDRHDLALTCIGPELWDSLAPGLRRNGVTLGYYDWPAGKRRTYLLPVCENGHDLVVAYGHDDRLTLYLAADLQSLRRRVGEVLWKRGLLTSPEYLVMRREM